MYSLSLNCRWHFKFLARKYVMLVWVEYETNCITSGHECDDVDNRHTIDRRQSKTLILSTNVDKKSLETD